MYKLAALVSIILLVSSNIWSQQNEPVSDEKFNADWAEIDKSPLPDWFNEAKFGIFVVWGPYSVPGNGHHRNILGKKTVVLDKVMATTATKTFTTTTAPMSF